MSTITRLTAPSIKPLDIPVKGAKPKIAQKFSDQIGLVVMDLHESLKAARGSVRGQPSFNPAFDANGNGRIDPADVAANNQLSRVLKSVQQEYADVPYLSGALQTALPQGVPSNDLIAGGLSQIRYQLERDRNKIADKVGVKTVDLQIKVLREAEQRFTASPSGAAS